MSQAVSSNADKREVRRDEVHYRSRGTLPDGRAVQLLVVNMSARGLMARCEAPLSEGERVRVQLPVAGWTEATIRWALGGRFGCELDAAIPLATYMMMLAAMIG